MSAHILLTGSIFRDPEQRTSQSGKTYVTTTLKAAAADNAASEFWDVLAFSETVQAELLRLRTGERLSLQGSLRLELYTTKAGEQRISRKIFADHALALRAPPKAKKPKPVSDGDAQPAIPGKVSILPSSDLDDDIPF